MPTPLPPVPAGYTATRLALHALAEQVIAPVRTQATGNEIALEVQPGGFGTPPLPDGGFAGVRDGALALGAADGTVTTAPLTSLRAAAEAAGLTTAAALPDAALTVDEESAATLAAVYAFADAALAALRAEATPDADASPIRLWPEHFDLAYEEGDEAAGQRAGFGVSPGDEHHPEPYAYVTAWTPPPPGPLWNAATFPGAELCYAELLAAADPHATVLAFWRERRDALRHG